MSDYTVRKLNFTGAQFENAINLHVNSIADQFDDTKTYALNDYVMYDGDLYMCIQAVTTAGEWNASNWEEHKIFDNEDVIIK